MRTPATRRHHSRVGLRYETDLTDAEWAVIAPHLPAPKLIGRPWELNSLINQEQTQKMSGQGSFRLSCHIAPRLSRG